MNQLIRFVLERVECTPEVTIGSLSVGGKPICWTCEDPVREIPGVPVAEWKIKHETAIPVGIYRIKRTFSERFQRTLPILLDVPGFTGIRIHTGNTTQDTSGCILPGFERRKNGVGSSQLAFREIIKWLDAIEWAADEPWIEIKSKELNHGI